MVIADIAVVIDAGMAGQAKEAGVLAGAIVAELVGLVAGTGLGDQHASVPSSSGSRTRNRPR
jgi:hypothetical protein